VLTLADTITHYAGEPITVVNGVALSNAYLYVISGRENCVFRFRRTAGFEEAGRMGSWGRSRSQFRTPVAVAYHRGIVYIADWKNHRVVCLDEDLNTINAFGFLRDARRTNPFPAVIDYLRHLGRLDPQTSRSTLNYAFARARLFVQELSQEVRTVGPIQLCGRFFRPREASFYKPDGFAFSDDALYVSQHYNHAVTRIDQRTGAFTVHGSYGSDHGEFDHPSNLLYIPDRDELLVSDVFNGRVEVFSGDFQYIRSIVGNSTSISGKFLPFGLAAVSDNCIAVCGAESIQLFELASGALLYDYRGDHDQFHGLAFDSATDRLFAADRLKHRVCIFEVNP